MGDDDEAWKGEHGGEDDEDNEDGDKIQAQPKLSEYERTKAKNIAELKEILAGLDEQYPMLKELEPKKVAKVLKKDQKGKEITIRRMLQRIADSDKIQSR